MRGAHRGGTERARGGSRGVGGAAAGVARGHARARRAAFRAAGRGNCERGGEHRTLRFARGVARARCGRVRRAAGRGDGGVGRGAREGAGRRRARARDGSDGRHARGACVWRAWSGRRAAPTPARLLLRARVRSGRRAPAPGIAPLALMRALWVTRRCGVFTRLWRRISNTCHATLSAPRALPPHSQAHESRFARAEAERRDERTAVATEVEGLRAQLRYVSKSQKSWRAALASRHEHEVQARVVQVRARLAARRALRAGLPQSRCCNSHPQLHAAPSDIGDDGHPARTTISCGLRRAAYTVPRPQERELLEASTRAREAATEDGHRREVAALEAALAAAREQHAAFEAALRAQGERLLEEL
eukprot:4591227-Prymnesium_polylepis.1